jgi:aryl-alcohol dehydrogenase-like predicted oxidoreductase/quinol monooxygenase YgiN
MLRYRLLGRSGLRVSELCLGTMTFGEEWQFGASKEESKAIFEAFSTAGGNFIDTANTYTDGMSEHLVGQFVRSDRDRFIISTKYSLSTCHADVNAGGNHRKCIYRSLERSLNQLNTEYIDIFWVHAWDGLTPVQEILRALDDLVRSGKVHYVGVSNTPAWVVARSATLAELQGWSSFIGLQVEYSLIERTSEHELLPMAGELGIGALGWAPLGGGVLTGKYTLQDTEVTIRDTKRGTWLNRDRLDLRTMTIASELQRVACEIDRPPAQVALAWVRQQPHGVLPIVGARTLQQFEQNLGCVTLVLEPVHLAALNKVSKTTPGFPHRFLASDPLRRALFGDHDANLDRPGSHSRADSLQSGLYVIARIRAHAGQRETLETAFRQLVPTVRRKNGCLEYEVASPAVTGLAGEAPFDADEVILLERWVDQGALERHLSDPIFRAWFDGIRHLIAHASMQLLKPNSRFVS